MEERQKKSEREKLKREQVDAKLSTSSLRAVQMAREKGASNWLSVKPSSELGFVLHKADFKDALALRYNRHIKDLPSLCQCGKPFSVSHAMSCKTGGFIHIRHNDIRDFETELLSKICHDVEKEPGLQPVTNETFAHKTCIGGDEARLDIRARGFWRRGQNAFFDVRVTNINAESQVDQSLEQILKKHEQEKKRAY